LQAAHPPLSAQAANPPPPAPAPAADLVREIQRLLAAVGRHSGPDDGIPGARTRAAIRAFQRDKGLAVDGEATPALRGSLRAEVEVEVAAAPVVLPRNRELANSGSGFAVTRGGHVLTSYHVVEGCAEITAKPAGGKSIKAETVAHDEANDLALIKIAAASTHAAFRFDRPMRAGDTIVAVGYPLPSLLASEAKISTGTVSALAGMHDDARHLQIAAPVQRGNSGGPLMDLKGHVAGIVVAKLDALKVAGAMGDLPQNVSFAVKSTVARAFLDSSGVAYEVAGAGRELKPAEIGEKAKSFTLQIECWK
jgi:S1-C subfamily serine protease